MTVTMPLQACRTSPPQCAVFEPPALLVIRLDSETRKLWGAGRFCRRGSAQDTIARILTSAREFVEKGIRACGYVGLATVIGLVSAELVQTGGPW